jgi:DNA (cytosine-5)-methyltransferase 1
MKKKLKIFNGYCGVGGNRLKWPDDEIEVVACDHNEEILAVYQRQFPNDECVLGDCHEYLRQNFENFGMIWVSPPCPTHSKMAKATRHKNRKYPDMKLYEEILFLDAFFKGIWVVENVLPFYEPLITPTTTVGRHCFWSSGSFTVEDVDRPAGFIQLSNQAGKKALQDWLGIHFDENIYYAGNHCPAQVLRNCVHPDIGLSVYKQLLSQPLQAKKTDQHQLF